MAALTSWQRYGPGWRALRKAVFATKGRRCYWCGAFATHVDHLVPRCRGGRHELANLVPACQRCNLSRGGKDSHYGRPKRPVQALQGAALLPGSPGGPSRDW